MEMSGVGLVELTAVFTKAQETDRAVANQFHSLASIAQAFAER